MVEIGKHLVEIVRTPKEHIEEMTAAKIRIFLAEVTEGVSSYRSLSSLTQQVEHQYHGRFLIELIQNAHDAFESLPTTECKNRIAIVFDPGDSEYGSLLVANDGKPFTSSNFERLSQLGQSDKDPQESIGNKGIGFRSVLQVCNSPEVYSKLSPSSTKFDGYCFAFMPSVVTSMIEPIALLAREGNDAVWPISGGRVLADWSAEMLAKFQQRFLVGGVEWLKAEINYLSPYLLPVPVSLDHSAQVTKFESDGFASVVRLPLKSAELRSYVLSKMQQLSAPTVLFLSRLGALTLEGGDSQNVAFVRKEEPVKGWGGGVSVEIADGNGPVRRYGMWTRTLHVPKASDEFRKAVAALPGRWPEIVDLSVSVAVRLGPEPEAGKFSIYLPTLQPTGAAVHVNAPFFGDMSRTDINFSDAYNRELLEVAGDLVVEVVRERLAGKQEEEACAIVDFIAPLGSGNESGEWLKSVKGAAERASASLTSEPLFLAGAGWRGLDITSLVPVSAKVTLLTESVLRKHATFDIFHSCLDTRTAQIVALANDAFGGVGAFPLPEDVAETIASVAKTLLHQTDADWNAFWRDVAALLPTGQEHLSKHELLLGTDGVLHCHSLGTKVFFVPRQGTQDDSDVAGEGGATEIPQLLRKSVAFLSEKIQLYVPSRPMQQTGVRAYLGGNGLVSTFRVETIFSEVLQGLTPNFPVPFEGDNHFLCRDILEWAVRLMNSVVARGKGSLATFSLLRTIPVPCLGGWYPMGEASFGEGWSGTLGEKLTSYLRILKSTSASNALQRALQPPGHVGWGVVGIKDMALLTSGGVFRGLRLKETKSSEWNSTFLASRVSLQLPGPPPSWNPDFWNAFVTAVGKETKPPYVKSMLYQVGEIFAFPGLEEYSGLSDEARRLLSELILESLPSWSAGLGPLSVVKQGGEWNKLELTSPLKLFLTGNAWLAVRDGKGVSWAKPSERWHIPVDTLAGRTKHYTHLRALPEGMATAIGNSPELTAALRMLGMQFFDAHTTSGSPALLVALTSAVGSEEVLDPNVLLGQIRDAWQRFRPTESQTALTQLAVRRTNKQLVALTPTSEGPVYLPDSGAYVSELEDFGFPVISIWPSDAKDLRAWFAKAYGERVQFTSTLALVPHVGDVAWNGSSSMALSESDMAWLVRPLLVLVAANGRGVHSAAFKERLDTLRGARLDWVPTLQIAVERDGEKLATTEVSALWEPQFKTLILSQRCRAHPDDMSAALAQCLKREDLELSLRFILRNIASIDNPPEDIADFVAPLRIEPEEVHRVIEHLRGDVGQMTQFSTLLVRVLSPDANYSAVQSATSEDELALALTSLQIENLDVSKVMQSARDSQDTFDFGYAVSPVFGSLSALARWNKILEDSSKHPLLNRAWGVQLQAWLEELSFLAKRVAVSALALRSDGIFGDLWDDYRKILGNVDLSKTHWSVGFGDAMKVIVDKVEAWGLGELVLRAMLDATTPDDLHSRLLAAGVAVESDPDEFSRLNHELVETVAKGIDQLRLAAWLDSKASGKDVSLESMVERYRAATAPALLGSAYISLWSEADVFRLIRTSISHPEMSALDAAMDSTKSLAALQEALCITSESLANAETRLEKLRIERSRLRRLVKVCGEDFDCAEENLSQLWDILSSHLSEASLEKAGLPDLTSPATLTQVKYRSGSKTGTPRAPSKMPQRQPKAVDELVGLAGEMIVFKMLRQRYGEEAVPASAWISGNSRRVFPTNDADDGMGCDFAFTSKGRQFRVEVKSSMGDDDGFKLGSSEIRLAMELGSKGKKRNASFVIIHVRKALSLEPVAVVLPNPYDPKHAGTFHIEEADARVRYSVKQ